MIKISPNRIKGQWDDGYALDFHIVRSNYIGDDEYGRPQFETTRTPMGELLYRYRSGATMNAVASQLRELGKVASVLHSR